MIICMLTITKSEFKITKLWKCQLIGKQATQSWLEHVSRSIIIILLIIISIIIIIIIIIYFIYNSIQDF